MSISLLTRNRNILCIGVALIALGVVGLVVNQSHNRQIEVRPLEVSLRDIAAEQQVHGQFTAQLGEPYDVEIEIDWTDPPNEVRRLISIVDTPSELEVRWSISDQDRVVASGDCRDYTYIRFEGSMISRLRDRVLGVVPDAKIATATLARGVGRFVPVPGQTYRMTVTGDDLVQQMRPFTPRMIIRVNRTFWQHHFGQTLPTGYAGLIGIGIGIALGIWWGLTVVLGKRS